MSNFINFERIVITHKKDCFVCEGYIAFDDHGHTCESFYEGVCSDDDEEFFKQVKENGNSFVIVLIEHIIEHGCDIHIDGVLYEWDVIKQWLNVE